MAIYSTLELEFTDSIAQLTLNRPDLGNRLDGFAHNELAAAFWELHDIKDLRAIVFSSRGKHFSAGGDMEFILALASDAALRREAAQEARSLFDAVSTLDVPIVSAMQGDAIGLGATMLLCSDAIVASRTAKIADPHVIIGLTAGDGGCVLWPQAIGLIRAKRYLLTGDSLSAVDAHSMGLITDLVDTPDEALPVAHSIAERIAALPPLAVQSTKRALNKVLRTRVEEVFDYALHYEMDSFTTDDLKEAVNSFKERRKPMYSGR